MNPVVDIVVPPNLDGVPADWYGDVGDVKSGVRRQCDVDRQVNDKITTTFRVC